MMNINKKNNFNKIVALSYFIAFLNFVLGPLRFIFLSQGNDMPISDILIVNSIIAILWLIIVIYAFVMYRFKALLALIGAPIALFWPGMFIFFAKLN